ncbi:hypothetical protein PT974_09738 [Cladobotryum mycophilum]|uniref:Uncharacterized protein n=1 Tax=Cladobotryum mycophilum TaxID=491253 RepID=A0ABR0SI10_9HYPO
MLFSKYFIFAATSTISLAQSAAGGVLRPVAGRAAEVINDFTESEAVHATISSMTPASRRPVREIPPKGRAVITALTKADSDVLVLVPGLDEVVTPLKLFCNALTISHALDNIPGLAALTGAARQLDCQNVS